MDITARHAEASTIRPNPRVIAGWALIVLGVVVGATGAPLSGLTVLAGLMIVVGAVLVAVAMGLVSGERAR